jgi:xanthine dehydrogenase accessory factor
MAATLVELASGVGWRADLVDVADFKSAHVSSKSVVVVATQGHGDEEAVEQAVNAGPAFVGLVASRKRGEAVLGYLADRGVSPELLERVKVPVGIDLGHTSHPEIAVSVLAELVELRAKGVLDPEPVTTMIPEPIAHHHDHEHEHAGTAIDPVCGMTVPADDTSRPFEHEGETYFFCCPGCRAAFEKDPSAYTTVRG